MISRMIAIANSTTRSRRQRKGEYKEGEYKDWRGAQRLGRAQRGIRQVYLAVTVPITPAADPMTYMYSSPPVRAS